MTMQRIATWNAHLRRWDDRPEMTGPFEVFSPEGDGTEELPWDANFDVEFFDEFDDLDAAVDALPCCGRFMISTSDDSRYIGFLNSYPGGVDVILY
jgi:hypothetical protein